MHGSMKLVVPDNIEENAPTRVNENKTGESYTMDPKNKESPSRKLL